ncbi:MAG: hypothetical protein KRP56_03790 [Candidatus Methanogranum gryphiswaldense]|nr:MAG: hypothetical protein KRP56_03790 [Candidatus Methanogranum sp. U3.2.1]
MKSCWKFPKTNSYQKIGINANEIDSRNSPIQTFVREICQNSNDSSVKSPVKVVFHKFMINTADFPDVDSFREVLGYCKNETRKIDKNTFAFEKYQQRENYLNKQNMTVMRISDFNTTGLIGSNENEDSATPWNAITLGKGISNKDSQSGGSKGRGKESFYRMSGIGCVFFSTLDTEGYEASLGCSYQITYRDDDNVKHDSVGCYNDENEKHSAHQLFLDPDFSRDVPGTDIYIPAFIDSSNDDDQIKLAVIRDFFVSILEKKLIIDINGVIIDDNSIQYVLGCLNPIAEEEVAEINRISELIKCFLEGPKYICADYGIYLAKSEDNFYVASVRAGMTISSKFHKLPREKIIGLAIIRSPKASSLLLSAEDISHNEWNIEVTDESRKKDVKNLINAIKGDIRKIADEMTALDMKDSKDAIGLNRYIPVNDENENVEISKKEFFYDPISRVKTKKKSSELSKPLATVKSILPAGQTEEESSFDYDSDTKPIHNDTNESVVDPLPPSVNPVSDSDYKRIFKIRQVNLIKVRTICTDIKNNSYHIMFNVDSSDEIYLKAHIIYADNSDGGAVDIKAAYGPNGTKYNVSDGRIGPIHPIKNERNALTIVLDYPISCRIDVEGEKIVQ